MNLQLKGTLTPNPSPIRWARVVCGGGAGPGEGWFILGDPARKKVLAEGHNLLRLRIVPLTYNKVMSGIHPDYNKRDCSLPAGCKDLIDVLRLETRQRSLPAELFCAQ